MDKERMLRWFEFAHLPLELQQVSHPFGVLAQEIVFTLSAGPERTVALRKLLEAKDAAVRAYLEGRDLANAGIDHEGKPRT